MTNLKHPHARQEALQVGRFGLVGILNTIVDIVVLNVLAATILPKSLIVTQFVIAGTVITITGVVLAGIISGTIAMINSFVFNARFTFRDRHVDTRHIVYFFVITMFGVYVIRPIVLKIFTDVWVWPSQLLYQITNGLRLPFSQDFDQRNLALFAAIGIVLVYNYLMYKKFVFIHEEAK
jgi:putative flippase GtrA